MTLLSTKNLFFLLKISLIFLTAVLLQVLVCPLLAFHGVVANLPLVIIIVSAMVLGLEVAIPLALAFILVFQGFFTNNHLFISWILTAPIAIYTFPQFGFSKNIIWIIQVVLCTLYIEILNLAFFSIFRGVEFFFDNYLILLLSPIMNGLLAVLVLPLFTKLFEFENSY